MLASFILIVINFQIEFGGKTITEGARVPVTFSAIWVKCLIIMKLRPLTQKGKQTTTKHFHDTAILLKCGKQMCKFLETTLLP